MHIVFVYTEAEMHILNVIQLILLFPFVCEAVGEVNRKGGPELPHLTLCNKYRLQSFTYVILYSFILRMNIYITIIKNVFSSSLNK